MPRTGRPTTPTEVKRLRGTLRKDRGGAAQPLSVLPSVVSVSKAPPAETGAQLVQRILDAGASAWIGTTDQAVALDLIAQAWDERRGLRDFVARNGYSDDSGRERPEMKRLGIVEKQITAWLSLLGLTPTDRSRLGVAEVKARSKLEELAARRSARTAGRRAS